MRRGWYVPFLTAAAVTALTQGALAYGPDGWDQKGLVSRKPATTGSEPVPINLPMRIFPRR